MRRKNDFYATPNFAIKELLKRIDINGKKVLEPCVGEGDISKVLSEANAIVTTNDIDVNMTAVTHLDAKDNALYSGEEDWIITNPPFNQALPIVEQGVKNAKEGAAFLLRLSFLEPTYSRGEWLKNNPPNKVLVLPRISFTGDGKTDSVTSAFFIWDKSKEHWIDFVLRQPK